MVPLPQKTFHLPLAVSPSVHVGLLRAKCFSFSAFDSSSSPSTLAVLPEPLHLLSAVCLPSSHTSSAGFITPSLSNSSGKSPHWRCHSSVNVIPSLSYSCRTRPYITRHRQAAFVWNLKLCWSSWKHEPLPHWKIKDDQEELIQHQQADFWLLWLTDTNHLWPQG